MKKTMGHVTLGVAAIAALTMTQGCRTVQDDTVDLSLRPTPAALTPDVSAEKTAARTPSGATVVYPDWYLKGEASPAAAKGPVGSATYTPAPAAKKPFGTTVYTVKKNDTLSGIAQAYKLRYADVLAVNAGIDPNRLIVGQDIYLPGDVDVAAPVVVKKAPAKSAALPASGTTYVVKNGDALSKIAAKFGTTSSALVKANNLKSADKIFVGQKLVIPGASAKSAPAAKSKSAAPATPPKSAVVAPPAPVAAEKVEAPKIEVPVVIPPPTEIKAPEVVTPEPIAASEAEIPDFAPPAIAIPVAEDNAAVTIAPPPAPLQTYTVLKGEDLYSIAVRWGISIRALQEANGLADGAVVAPGTVLNIPAAK